MTDNNGTTLAEVAALDIAAALAKANDPEAPAEEAPAEDAPAEEPSDGLSKADFTDIIDRLTKGDFGNTESAHNGNADDKSSPMGEPASFGAAGEDPKAAARIAASVERARAAELAKSEEDEDDDLEKSQDDLSEDDIYAALTDDEGAESFVPIAEGSEAIQYLTDTFAKAFSHVSAQVAALSQELHSRVDNIEKSQSVLRDAAAVLVKSAQRTTETPMAKSMLTPVTTPASGVVIINSGTTSGAPDGKVESRGVLAKSIQNAMTEGRISEALGSQTLLRLDSQPVDQVWNSLTQTTRDAIFDKAK